MSIICILVKAKYLFSNTTLVILYIMTTFSLFNLGIYLFKTCNCTRSWCSLLYTLMILQEAGYKTFCVGLRSFYRKLSSSAFGKSVSSSSTIFYTNVGNHTSHKFVFSAFFSPFQWCLPMSNLLNHLPVFVFVYLFFQRHILLTFRYANSIFRRTNLSTILRWPELLLSFFSIIIIGHLIDPFNWKCIWGVYEINKIYEVSRNCIEITNYQIIYYKLTHVYIASENNCIYFEFIQRTNLNIFTLHARHRNVLTLRLLRF